MVSKKDELVGDGSGGEVDSGVDVGGSLVGGSGVGGAVVDVGTGAVVDVGVGAVGEVGGMFPVGVGVGFCGRGVELGAMSVLIGVRKIGVRGVKVTTGVPAPNPVSGMSGQVCSVIGNCRQFDSPTQIFKLNVANCGPRQSRMRRPFTSWAVKQLTPPVVSDTLKDAWLDTIRTACASSLTQN